MLVFAKLKSALKEYNHDNQVDLSLHQFFVEVLNYSEEEFNEFLIVKKTHIKPVKEHKDKVPYIPKEVGDKDNPEYEKYCNMVLAFKEYMCNKEIRPEGDERKTMRTFMKYAYGIEGDAATLEMRKIEYIVYKGKVSRSKKRNRRRAKREQEFKEKFNL